MRESYIALGDYNATAEQVHQAFDLANGYRPFVAAMPEAAAKTIPAAATYEPRVSIPANSWLWAISGISAQAAGFNVQVTDLATRKPLFSQPVSFDLANGGTVTYEDCYGQVRTVGSRLHMLPRPLAILAPGLLGVKIVNQAAAANTLQLCLHFALPGKLAPEQKNEWNQALELEINRAMRAIRDAGSSLYSSSTGGAFQSGGAFVQGGGGSIGGTDQELIHLQYDVTAVGDNIIAAGNAGGKIYVYQVDLWNVAQQTIQFFSGSTPLRGPLTDFPATMGYGLANNGKPHFECAPGQPFIIRLSAGTPCTGFIKYRME